MAERGGIFWQRGKTRSAALPPRDILEPFKEAAACILGIHFASIKHANCEEGEEERNVSHAFIQPLMMLLLSKLLEGRRDATNVKRGRQERGPLEMPSNSFRPRPSGLIEASEYVFAGRRKWIRHDKYCVNGEGKRGKRAIDDVLLNGRANRGKISVRGA